MARIVVVEDDPNVSRLYETELRADGHVVSLVDNGRDAVTRVMEVRPDVVVMDIRLPRMDGIEAMWRILSEDKSIAVIINTAYREYQANFMTWGAEAYVLKGPDVEPLKEAIRAVLARRQA